MEEDVLNALQTRTAYIPGGFDRNGKIIFIVNISNDLLLWNRKCLELSIIYLKRSLSPTILQKGVTVIVDAQRSTTRITRTHARTIYGLFGEVAVDLYLVRAECFWEKHVEQCAKSHTNGEPIVLPKARLTKYFELNNLPEDLGGTLHFNYDLWLQQRKSIDEFQKNCERTLSAMESFHGILLNNKSLRPTEASNELKKCANLHSTIQRNIESSIDMGNGILARLSEVYAQPLPSALVHAVPQQSTTTTIAASHHDNNAPAKQQQQQQQQQQKQQTASHKLATIANSSAHNLHQNHHQQTTPSHVQCNNNNGQRSCMSGQQSSSITNTTTAATITKLPTLSSPTSPHLVVAAHNNSSNNNNKLHTLPPDLQFERTRIELRLNEIEKRQTEIRTAWLELLQSIREARELATLADGVAFVTNWILNTAEQLLCRQQTIGGDVRACETLRNAHNALEMDCRETYGHYAELLYKIDCFNGAKHSLAYKDLLSQRDFMHFVCRSFATRLERRRNVLITSLRFFRLVGEYFDRTTVVFESLVMGSSLEAGGSGKLANENDFTQAAGNLQKLKESQLSLAAIEREIIKEGEKLSDMLAMPVKDALGRDLHIDYSEDITNIREILDTTIARRQIFSDSVELQKLTLEQVTHIHKYELDAKMAINWMDELYNVMIRCHSHVGCNIHEIQVQKDELQTFQETGKSIYNYGSQLLEASQALRASCRLDVMAAKKMLQQLQRTWHSLQAISQEHMTRLRVSAVFHRSVEEYCQQLHDLRTAVGHLTQQSSSSGISSASASQQVSPASDGDADNVDGSSYHHIDEYHQPSGASHAAADATSVAVGGHDGNGTVPAAVGDAIAMPIMNNSTQMQQQIATDRREQLRRYLNEREQLLLEVGRMVRLGRLLKTRLKEPFILDAVTGKR